MRFESKPVQVKITRSAQFSPVIRTFEHEVPILQAIHGEEMVMVLPAVKGATARVFDSDAERARLSNKYPKIGNPRVSPVELVYGNRMNSTLGKGLPQPAPAKGKKQAAAEEATA